MSSNLSQKSPQSTPSDAPWLRFDFPRAVAVSHSDPESDPNAIPGGNHHALLFTRPERILIAHRLEEVVPTLEEVQAAVDAGFYAAGFVSYEAGWALDTSFLKGAISDGVVASSFSPPVADSSLIDSSLIDSSLVDSSLVDSSLVDPSLVDPSLINSALADSPFASFPLVWFGVYRSPEQVTEDGLSESESEPDTDSAYQVSDWCPTVSRERYAQDIATIRDLIGRGETYQVNHTLRLRAEVTGSEQALYRQLVRAQRPAYAAHLALGRYSLLSVSPELFFYRRGNQIVTRPMKGTIGRGATPDEDQQRADTLAASVKDRAENLMIVDLLRNDLGRLALPGSVRVSRLFDIEPYPNVWQMTSTIEARLPSAPPSVPTLLTLLTALFPCGSITGAPKINTMRHIARLETAPRHIYCGAIGYLTPHADPQLRETIFNVAIRTVLLDTHTHIAEYGVGSGITWDSTSDDEYAELLLKAKILKAKKLKTKILNGNSNLPETTSAPVSTPSGNAPELELLESLRLEKGRYWLLERHMERLERASSHFGYPLSLQEVRAQLDALALQSLRKESELIGSELTESELTESRPEKNLEKNSEKKFEEKLAKTASNEIQNSLPSDKPSEGLEKSASQSASPNGTEIGTGGKSGSGQLEEQHNLGDVARNTAAARQEQPAKIWKVRCLVSAEGRVRLERLELGPDGKFPLSVVLAQRPVSRDEPLLYHKTTHRALYEAHLAEAQARQCGLFDVLLWNAEGELTEFTQGNLVASVRGRLLTPPVSSGLLAGTLRAELLARGDVHEKVIRHEDLAHTTGMWLINSVRGWLPVRLLDNPYAHKRI